MKQFLTSLRKEHIELRGLMSVIVSKGAGSPEGGAAIKDFFEKLEGHIDAESENLYPPLLEASHRTDIIYGLEGIVRTISREMEDVAAQFRRFKLEYDADPQVPEIDHRFHHLSELLATRIRKEEETVFRFYEKLVE